METTNPTQAYHKVKKSRKSKTIRDNNNDALQSHKKNRAHQNRGHDHKGEHGEKKKDKKMHNKKQKRGTFSRETAPIYDVDRCWRCGDLFQLIQSESINICTNLKCVAMGTVTVPYLASTNAGVAFGEDAEANLVPHEKMKNFRTKIIQFTEDAPHIPATTVLDVHAELCKNRTLSPHQIKSTPVEKILKRLGYSTEIQSSAGRICNRLTGAPSAIFTREEMTKLTSMYIDFKSVFQRPKRGVKQIFPPVHFMIHKFSKANGWHERASTFPLMKDRDTLEQSDSVFAPACQLLNWSFERSI
jgi:hypothetical protein